MRRLVDRRGTIAVNNACDLCNKRLARAAGAAQFDAAKSFRLGTSPTHSVCAQLRDIRCTTDVTCICACHYARRAAQYISRRIVIFVDAASTICRLQTNIAIVNITCEERRRKSKTRNDGICTALLLEVSRYARQINKFKIYI